MSNATSASSSSVNTSGGRSQRRVEERDNGNEGGEGVADAENHVNGGRTNGKGYGNPAHKKGWQQKKPGEYNNQPEERLKMRRDNREVKNSPNSEGNGERKYDNKGEYRRNTNNNNRGRSSQTNYNNNYSASSSSEQRQEQPFHPPHVDQSRIDESIRINELLGTSPQRVSEQEMQIVEHLLMLCPSYSKEDALAVLQQAGGDREKAASMMTEENGNSQPGSWSEVVKKRAQSKIPEKGNARVVVSYDARREAERRPKRVDRPLHVVAAPVPLPEEHQDAQGQAQVQQQPPPQQQPHHSPHQQVQQQHQHHPQQQLIPPPHQQQPQQQHPQAHQPHQQPHQQQQIQHQQIQHQHQMQHQQQIQPHQQHQIQPHQQHHPDPFELNGEDLLVGLSQAIETQLAEIATKTRLLIQMQNELQAIHLTGKDQLSNLQEEKEQLANQKQELTLELARVEERIKVVDVEISKAEKEKLLKLQDLKRKSASHGLITNS